MDKNPFLRSVTTDPCLFFFDSSDVLKKNTKVLDIFNTDKKSFIKINIESSRTEILIRIRFLEINESQSLIKAIPFKKKLWFLWETHIFSKKAILFAYVNWAINIWMSYNNILWNSSFLQQNGLKSIGKVDWAIFIDVFLFAGVGVSLYF